MVNKKLVSLIRQELQKGKTFESIKMSLLNSDYSLKEVDEAIRVAKIPTKPVGKPLKFKPQMPSTPKSSKSTSKTILVLFLILLVFSIYMHYKTGSSLKICRTQLGTRMEVGGIKIFNYVITEGTQCDALGIKLALFKLSIVVTGLGTLYTGYTLRKSQR